MFRFWIPMGKIGIALPMRQHNRLLETCFRGTDVREAGNFKRWPSFALMMHDQKLTDSLCEIVDDILREKGLPTRDHNYTEVISVQLDEAVGWTSTIPCEEAQNIPSERRPLNKQSEALFIADKSVLAPLTNIVTFAMEFRIDLMGTLDALVLIHSLYPGPGVGPLIGNMTEATGLVWFDFHHPGGDQLVHIEP